ncbi:acyl-CoA synthetase [Barrientosiimonas endolithica]|uniref:Acyl-CoA synthetase n=1 Tax=Barrientosiimonas endolithica TaxID=1535208 RepID=A0ABM8H6S0_9MICO|nr:acyl-CoA synthetase [Barrientosiimonas endolithica]
MSTEPTAPAVPAPTDAEQTPTGLVSTTPLTPLSYLERSGRVWADKLAVIDGEARWTYAELAADVQRMAKALGRAGVEPGDRVAFVLPNVSEMLMAHFAVPLAQGVLVAVNTRLAPPEVRHILEHSGARVVVAWPGTADLVESATEGLKGLTRVMLREPRAGWTSLGELADDDAPDLSWRVEDELAPISLNYTSGTTGRPKGVLYSHRGAHLNALSELLHSRHSPRSVYLWTLPMFHCNGWCTPWAITAIGGTHVCLPEVRGDAIWEAIREHGVTHLNAAPTVVTTMLNTPGAGGLERPVVITTAGAPPSPTTLGQMADMGFEVVHVYGLTETYGPYTVCEVQPGWAELEPGERARLLARQGVGMITAERARVVDAEMNDVPADGETLGEIVMRGDNVMLGYYRDEEATATAFAGGWFHSGDVAVMHPDGYVEIRDRAKDVVISGGENISTVEVEQALMSHPSVLEVAVVGVPDEKWGERPKAFVTTKGGAGVDEAELIEHVRGQIAHYKAPREVEVVEELPKTSTGKIQKFRLRDAEWAGRDSRVQG